MIGPLRTKVRSLSRFLVALPVVVVAVAFTAHAAGEGQEVTGTITGGLVPDVYSEAAKTENHRFSWREASLSVDSRARQLYANVAREVCIAVYGGPAQTPAPINIRVSGGRANPVTIAVPPRTKLIFKNNDPFPHTLYQVTPAAPAWKSTLKPHGIPDEQRNWEAPADVKAATTFEIRDELFPSVRLYIVVDPLISDYTIPFRDGKFATKRLPPGHYTLKAFFAGKQVGKEQPVDVTDKTPVEIKDWPVGGDAK